jgi:lipopolysaccharide/colanic/teichoic acid biosynthesis glycosyltransferase
MLMLSGLIALRMGWPVIFYQRRAGLHGKSFGMIKFRTMTSERGADGELLPDGDRITALGCWLRNLSLDELPELLNVLKGDMSLVGPRPLLPEYLPYYSPEQARRHETRPGLTGWAQVNGRNATGWEQRLDQDIWYIENWSLALDLRIIFMTISKVFKRDGITAEGHATMPRFDDFMRNKDLTSAH